MAQKDASSVIYKWIVDYMLYKSWKEFKTSHTLEQCTIDMISGLFGMGFENEGTDGLIRQKLLMVIMCRIVDGQCIDVKYDEASEVDSNEAKQTPLEDMLTHFENLVLRQSDKDLIDEGSELMIIIKIEAVLACCRAKDFTQAMEVFKRQFSDFDKTNKYYKKVQDLQKKIQTRQKSSNMYDKFVESIISYIDKIMVKLDEPLLIQAATSILAGSENSLESPWTGKQKRLHPDVLEPTKDNTEGNESLLSQKLRTLWDANIKEMFGCSTKKHTKPVPSTTEVAQASTVSLNQSTPKKTSCSNSIMSNTANMPEQTGSSIHKSSYRHASPDGRFHKAQTDRHKEVIQAESSESDTVASPSQPSPMRRKWTDEEMLEFYNAVIDIGVGKWAQIKDFLDTQRTSVMLKDKWRTMVNNGDVKRLSAKGQKKRKTLD